MSSQEATCLEDPRLAALKAQQCPDGRRLPSSDRRAIQRWRPGVQATITMVDRVLINLGLSVHDIPDDCCCAYRNSRHGWRKSQ